MVKILLALFWLFTAPPVDVNVMPRIAIAPATIRVRVKVEPKDTNRGLTIAINGENYYRSSFDPDFAGSDGAAVGNYMYDIRDPGHYTIIAILHRALPDKNERAETTLCLTGTDVEC